MGNIYRHSKLFFSVLLLFAPILTQAQASTTTTTEPTPPLLPGITYPKVSETTTNATSTAATTESTSTESTTTSTTTSSTVTTILTTTLRTSNNLANEPAKIIGIAIGIALLCLLIILGGIALQKHIRRQRIKKEEATPPKDFQNPVQMSTGEATV